MKKTIAYILAATCAAALSCRLRRTDAGGARRQRRGSNFEDTAEERALAGMSLRQKAAQVVMASCHENGGAERRGGLRRRRALPLFRRLSGQDGGGGARHDSRAAIRRRPAAADKRRRGGRQRLPRQRESPAAREAFKAPLELLSEGGTALLESDTAEKSALLLSLGVNVNLAPVCDVPLSESDYIYERSFGLDARTSSDLRLPRRGRDEARASVCALKHFPGYGGSADTHRGVSPTTGGLLRL